jgi:hypothetical protein
MLLKIYDVGRDPAVKLVLHPQGLELVLEGPSRTYTYTRYVLEGETPAYLLYGLAGGGPVGILPYEFSIDPVLEEKILVAARSKCQELFGHWELQPDTISQCPKLYYNELTGCEVGPDQGYAGCWVRFDDETHHFNIHYNDMIEQINSGDYPWALYKKDNPFWGD